MTGSRYKRSAAGCLQTSPPELVEEIISASPDRPAAILAAWNTGNIVQRQVAAREISRAFPAGQSLPGELESVVLAGALDVDMNVREAALGIFRDHKVRLAELRRKVVLINFWTTWCPACVSKMPELIALQKQHGDRLAIIGVSLDFVPDSHGHIGGHPAVGEQGGHAEEDSHERNSAALKNVRNKVARTVKARGINYTILLDELKRLESH